MESVEPAGGSTVSTATARNVAVRCSACHHGGPPARRMAGTETFGPAAEITIMTSIEAAIAAAASQPVKGARGGGWGVSSDEPGRLAWVALVASTPSLSLTESPVRYWSWSWLPPSRVRD